MSKNNRSIFNKLLFYLFIAIIGFSFGYVFGGRIENLKHKAERYLYKKDKSNQTDEIIISDLRQTLKVKGEKEAVRQAKKILADPTESRLHDEVLCFLGELETQASGVISPHYKFLREQYPKDNMSAAGYLNAALSESDLQEGARLFKEFVKNYPESWAVGGEGFVLAKKCISLNKSELAVDILSTMLSGSLSYSQKAHVFLQIAEIKLKSKDVVSCKYEIERCGMALEKAVFWPSDFEKRRLEVIRQIEENGG